MATVPGTPSAPATNGPAAAGPVVSRAGASGWSLTHQSKYSAFAQTRGAAGQSSSGQAGARQSAGALTVGGANGPAVAGGGATVGASASASPAPAASPTSEPKNPFRITITFLRDGETQAMAKHSGRRGRAPPRAEDVSSE